MHVQLEANLGKESRSDLRAIEPSNDARYWTIDRFAETKSEDRAKISQSAA